MKRRFNEALLILMGISTVLFSGCEKKSPVDPGIVTDPEVKTGDVAIITRVGAPDRDGSAWLQLIDGVNPKNITNKNAYQVPWGGAPVRYKDELYTLPDYSPTGSLIMTKWKKVGLKLVKSGEMELPAQSYAQGIAFASPTKAYVSTWLGKMLIFNPQNMTITGEIDLLPYVAEGIPTSLPGGIFLTGNSLYVPLVQVNRNWQPVTEPAVEVAVINTQTERVEKVIKETTSGLSGGPYQSSETTFFDEKGDMYMMCSGAYGTDANYKTGFLRIKNGESDFDPDYKWVLNDQEIIGDPHKCIWLEVTAYGGNGKVYGMVDIPEYRKDPKVANWNEDKSVLAVEMDLYAKTMRKLDIPLSTSLAAVIAKYKDLIVFGNISEHENGFYTYNPKTGETSKGAVIKVIGQPTNFYWFSE